jgi:hypothetical protein
MAIAAAVEAVPLVAAIITAFKVAAQSRRAAYLD